MTIQFEPGNGDVLPDGIDPAHVCESSFAYDLILSMSDAFSLVDSNGVALDANPALCRITGFSKEELVGKGPPHPYWPPEEYTRIQAAFEETLNDSGSAFELTFMRKCGQRFPAIVNAFSIKSQDSDRICYAATVKDITERKRSESAMRDWNQSLELRVGIRTAELKQSETRFRQLADVTFEGIVISENGMIIDANQQIASILGYGLPEMIGIPVINCVAPESRALVSLQIQEGIEDPYEFIGMRKDHTTLPMEAHGQIMDWNGKKARVTALRDLSAAKSAEARLLRQKAELDSAVRLALISEVSAGIIHQISQPLSTIGIQVSSFKARLDSGEMEMGECKNFLYQLTANIVRMRDSVIHLKALANPEQPKRLRIHLNDLVEEALGLVRSESGDLRFEIMTELDPDLPLLFLDWVQISQVVINLIRNAMDACREFPLERRMIRVVTRFIEEQRVELSIRDLGIGLSPSVMSHLFDPFFTTKTNGFGVGLRLSRTIIDAHGGVLEGFNNSEGLGATFRVSIPLGVVADNTKV